MFVGPPGTALEKQLASIDAARRVKSGSVEVHLQASASDGVMPGEPLQFIIYMCPQLCMCHQLQTHCHGNHVHPGSFSFLGAGVM